MGDNHSLFTQVFREKKHITVNYTNVLITADTGCHPEACFFVISRALWSYFLRSVLNNLAISGIRGSSGLGSDIKASMDSNTEIKQNFIHFVMIKIHDFKDTDLSRWHRSWCSLPLLWKETQKEPTNHLKGQC